MIERMSVRGQFERVIKLDTTPEHAYHYFADFNYVLPRLPEIERIVRYRDGRYRMFFSADDGRGHEMSVVFDIRHEVIPNEHIKMIAVPLTLERLRNDKLTNPKSPVFPGVFNGETLFYDRHTHTEVIYRVNLLVEVEVPRFLQFMPKNVLQGLGDTVMRMKLHQIADGFANRVALDFGAWFDPYYQQRQREASKQTGNVATQVEVKLETQIGEVVPLIHSVTTPDEHSSTSLN